MIWWCSTADLYVIVKISSYWDSRVLSHANMNRNPQKPYIFSKHSTYRILGEFGPVPNLHILCKLAVYGHMINKNMFLGENKQILGKYEQEPPEAISFLEAPILVNMRGFWSWTQLAYFMQISHVWSHDLVVINSRSVFYCENKQLLGFQGP